MKLSDQVVSLELAKTLKELGVKQNAYWSWYENGDNADLLHNSEGYRSFENKTFDAYTVAELGELLINGGQNFFPYYCDQTNEKCFVHNWSDSYPDYVLSKKESDCRAKMLIYLIENKLLTPSHE